MNSKIWKTLVIGMMVLAFTACDDDNSSNTSEEIGKPCDEATYGHQCDGRFILACEKGAIVAFEDCGKRGKDYVCAGEENLAGCIMPCKGDDEKFYCEYSETYGFAVSAKYVCYENYAYIPLDSSIVMCLNGCNEDNTACKKVHKEEGNKCDKDTYTNKCDERIAVACSKGVVTAIDCGEGNVCIENKNGTLSCKTPCTGNEEKFICKETLLKAYSQKLVCEDGYFVEDEESKVRCYDGCNENNTACAE